MQATRQAGDGKRPFREDINGLRAVAVLAVVLYHFHWPFITGGFAGVDVFFVISGFLMTQIVVTGLSQGRFSLLEFYAARFRRIFPALLALCLTLLVFGWFWLAPADYAALGKHAAGSTGFYSNFLYRAESGYFDSPSKFKWLLHTWSLSVEWQFYLLYPLVLMAVARRAKDLRVVLKHSLWGMAALSFALSLFYTPAKPDFAFYILPTRIWELVAGGLVFLYAPQGGSHAGKGLELAGLLLVFLSVFLFNELTPWPGYAAALPVLGAALVLWGGEAFLLRSRPVQWLGSASYSIYLWHWPVTVALGWFVPGSPGWTMLGIGLSLVLGGLSWRFIEKPCRRRLAAFDTRKTLAVGMAAMLLVVSIGSGIRMIDGVKGRVPEQVQLADNEAFNYSRMRDGNVACGFNRQTGILPDCILGRNRGDAPPPLMLVGDSHAGAVMETAAEATEGLGISFYNFSCITLFDTELKVQATRHNNCPAFNRAVLEKIKAMPENGQVVVVNRYAVNLRGPNEGERKKWGIDYLNLTPEEQRMEQDELYAKRLGDTLCEMQKYRPVSAILPIPEMGVDVPKTLARILMREGQAADITLPLADYYARQAPVLKALRQAQTRCGITLLDPVPLLCPDGKNCRGSYQGRPLYYDDDHLSLYGSEWLLPLFRQVMSREYP